MVMIPLKLPTHTSEKPAGKVRWRGLPDGQKVLQQYWAVTAYAEDGEILGQHGEWRDVPIEFD